MSIEVIRIQHGKANALDLELCHELERRFSEAAEASAVVITGTGSIFSAGVDLVRMTTEGAPYVEQFVPALTSMLQVLFTFPRPVVSAINGHAIAGGCVIAAASDVRVMAAGDGRIGVPELLVGVPMPSMVLEVCRFAFAPPLLQELIYRGVTLKADEAHRRGLVDELVEPAELESRALAIAEQLAAIAPATFALTKRQLRAPALARAADSAREHDAEMLTQWKSSETHAHIREYLARTVRKKS
jgi:enoyl-CoA hydratase